MHHPTIISDIEIGGITLKLETVESFDELLDHYAEHKPDAVDLIPYYAHLWDSAHGLCEYMVDNAELITGKRVLELGCGLAMPSLLAAKLGASSVLATDFHPDVGPFVERNVVHNDLQDRVSYAPFNWHETPADSVQSSVSAQASKGAVREVVDVILASDVLYEDAAIKPFVRRAANLCRIGGTILLADPGRTRLEHAVDCFEAKGFAADVEIVREVFVLRLTA